MSIVDLLGATLVHEDATISSDLVLARQYVGLYFSASWCGPCKRFTPKLAEWYAKQTNVTLIFVSLDTSLEDFNAYRAKMSWPALPYDGSISDALSNQFGVEGIPRLVILDHDCNIVNSNARDAVLNNETIA